MNLVACRHDADAQKSEHTTGYGDYSGRRVCFRCCASFDIGAMLKDGHSKRLPLYLGKDEHGWYVGNWPGTLKFRCGEPSKGRHNIAGTRHDVWFIGPDRYYWHGTQYGEWTTIVHCKRTRERFQATA